MDLAQTTIPGAVSDGESGSMTASARLAAERPAQDAGEPAASPNGHAADAGAPTEVDEVGILFVHGMGKHERGDFLQQIGDPLYRWISAWLGQGDREASRRSVRARESSFRVAHIDDARAPAHSVVETMVAGADGRRRRIKWVAVDGWWTDEVVTPSFSQVASWGLGLGPWMIVRYFRRHWHGLLVVPSLVVVVLFQLLILTLSVFGAVPKLRHYVTGLQLKVTGSIGDVMVMVANPLQFSAMTSRLDSDLRWLHTQVPGGRIAVVAHSQGTGVAHAALQASHVPVDLLVTFGTALEKLHLAREVQQNPRRLALGSTLTIAGGILLALAAAIAFKMESPQLTDSASLVGRYLLGAGAVLLMARTGLWFHLHRFGGALLTASGIAVLLPGLVLTAAAWTGADGPWQSAFRAMTVSRFWDGWTDASWRGVALGFIAFGLLMVLVREYTAFFTRERYAAGGPHPHPKLRPFDRSGPLGFVLDPGSAVGNFVGAAALVVGFYCLAMAIPPDRSAEGSTILVLVVAGLALCFAAVPLPIARIAEPTARDLRLPRREARMTWHNYWASADPVPDGDLPIDTTPYVINHEVRNRGSILADHTSYTENREEFLADLARHLSTVADWTAVRPDDARAIERAQRRRRWRVRFLTAGRWGSTVGMMIAWWVLGSAGLAVLGEPMSAVIGYFIGILPGVDSETVENGLPEAVLGMIAVAAIASFWYRGVLSPAWRYWDLVEGDVLARRDRPDTALSRERTVAVTLYALGSAIGLCTAIWSASLLQMVIDMREVLREPGGGDSAIALFLRWPWQRDVLLESGPWGLALPYIVVATLLVAAIYALGIRASIRASS